MALAINGTDNNPFTTRDIAALDANFVWSFHRVVPSGNYATGGDTLDLSTIAGLIPSGSLPVVIYVNGQGSGDCQTAEGGYYSVKQGTTLKNFLLQVWEPGGTELGAGAYDPEVIADVITLEILWRKLI